jgi:hypothetical protein
MFVVERLTSEGIGVENEFGRIFGAMLELLWTALPPLAWQVMRNL